MKKVIFHNKELSVKITTYQEPKDRIAIVLIDDEYPEEVYAIATVNIPEESIAKDEVIIKNYSENEGMLDSLAIAGIITFPSRYIKTGFVECPVCKLIS